MGDWVRTTRLLGASALAALVAVIALNASIGANHGRAEAALSAAKSHPLFGFNEDWVTHEKRISFVARGGADTIRAVISWSEVEPRQGVFRWNRYDRMYGRMLKNGTKPLWVLSDAPCWARELTRERCREEGLPGHPPAESRVTEFALFAAYVAQRYPEAVAIEAWNEPNLHSFWNPSPDPERAARLTAWANAGVDVVDREMPVVLGGLAPVLESVPDEQIKYTSFIRRAYAAVGIGHWDAVAIHPFPSFQKSTHYLREIEAHLDRVRSALRQSRAAGTDIWVTEIGLSTEGLRPYSGEEQAKGLVRIYRGLAAMKDVPAVIVHRLIDQPRGEKTAESGWGIIRRSGSIKPAYCALAEERGMECGEGR
ncbi:MAG: hypothetical protein ACR2OC_02595 [Solirubrobacterales bacterium]